MFGNALSVSSIEPDHCLLLLELVYNIPKSFFRTLASSGFSVGQGDVPGGDLKKAVGMI
jgi:hypothetical protein